MNRRRLSSLALCLGAFAALAPCQAAAESTPAETAQGLCDALISAMKQGPSLGFSGRKSMLEPELRLALNLPLMTRLVLGPPWRALSPEQDANPDALKALRTALGIASIKYTEEQWTPLPTSRANPMPPGTRVILYI